MILIQNEVTIKIKLKRTSFWSCKENDIRRAIYPNNNNNHPLSLTLRFTLGGLRPESRDEIPLRGEGCDTPVSPRVSLKKPNQEPSFYVNQSKHEHQNNLSNKEFTKYILKSNMIKTIESFKKIRMYNPNKNPKWAPWAKFKKIRKRGWKV